MEPQQRRLSHELESWLRSDGDKSLRSLVGVFGDSSFAILFVLLLGVSALPLPTGGVTHVLEIIAMLLALQLIAGREQLWLPARWRELQLAGERQERFISALMKMIRWLERYSRPRLRLLFNHRLTNMVLEDALVVAAAIVIGIVGVVLEVVLGAAAIKGISSLL